MNEHSVATAHLLEVCGEPRLAFRTDVSRWAERINVIPRRVQVQRMTRKWASCSTTGTLTFSFDLLQEPAAFRDYVIVHELLHLLVPNHGRVFKGLLRAYLHQGRASRDHDLRLGCRVQGDLA